MKSVLINTKNTLKGSYLNINNLSVFPRWQADGDPESSVFNVLWQFSALSFKFVQTHILFLSGPVLSRVKGEQGEQERCHRQCQTAGCQPCTTGGLVAHILEDAWFNGRRGGEVDVAVTVAGGRVAATSAFLSAAGIL